MAPNCHWCPFLASNSRVTIPLFLPHYKCADCRGDEADRIKAFKDAIGLADEDAAPVHIDVGRRIMRSRFEAGSRSGSSEQFRALQKLIYVSDLVFGAQKVGWQLKVAWGYFVKKIMHNFNAHKSMHPVFLLPADCSVLLLGL